MDNPPDADLVSPLVDRSHNGFYTGHAPAYTPDNAQSRRGRRRVIHHAGIIVLADRAVVLYPAWYFRAQAERVLFDLYQLADGSLRAPDERLICIMLVPAFDWFELSVECSPGKFMDDAGWHWRTCLYQDSLARGQLCVLSRYERVVADRV